MDRPDTSPVYDVSELATRLRRFSRAVETLPAFGDGDTGRDGALRRIETLVPRVKSLTNFMDEPSARWDAVDHAAARVMLADLATIVDELRRAIGEVGVRLADVDAAHSGTAVLLRQVVGEYELVRAQALAEIREGAVETTRDGPTADADVVPASAVAISISVITPDDPLDGR